MKYNIIQIKDVGWIAVAWSNNRLAVLTLPYPSPEAALEQLHDYVDPTQLIAGDADTEQVLCLRRELSKYFGGQRCQLNFPVDLSWCTPFQRQVLESISTIPYGETRSYQQVAAMIGKPTASRAVGGALRNNRVLLVLPCHRVIRSDGSLGGFGGIENSDWKRKFLAIERD
ncbi:methylated-DNA--[protein]-cysteine S-methyltransferase [Peptococcaceae bacterium 1198_IL3148]